jgi:uncharacterized protein
MTSLFKKLIIAAILFTTASAFPAGASTPEPPAMPRDYVVDLANVLQSDVKARLNATLQELEQKTTAQVLVLTVLSLDNEDIAGFSLRMAEKWKLGQKGKDNGVLIVVAVQDRKYRIEVGYGLESILPDSLVGTIGREYLVPNFRQGDYSTGTYAATLAVIRTIAEHEGVQLSGMPNMRPASDQRSLRPMSIFQLIVLGIFGVIMLIACIMNPRMCLFLLLASQTGGRRGGWSGGGGGFGGGGGGGFGGGGASGSW